MPLGETRHRGACAGEDTEFQPLVPDLIAALNSADRAPALTAVGRRYVAAMRGRVPANSPNPSPARIVDKMLRNAWNVGHIAIALPRAQVVRKRAWELRLKVHVVQPAVCVHYRSRACVLGFRVLCITWRRHRVCSTGVSHACQGFRMLVVACRWRVCIAGAGLSLRVQGLIKARVVSRKHLRERGL